MKKIAFIDLMFRWPPSGGATTDLKEVISSLSERGYPVKLFIAHFEDYLPRGRIDVSLPFDVERISFNKYSFNRKTLPSKFARAVEKYKPDIVFIGDGYNMKPFLLEGLRGYKTILRFYAYEVLCYTYNLINNKEENCDNNIFIDIEKCKRCKFPSFPAIKGFLDVYLGLDKRGDLFRLLNIQEILASGAFSSAYPKKASRLISNASQIIVYNEMTKSLLAGINRNINVFPSGVDTKRFKPLERQKSKKKVILMPGRISFKPKGFHIMEEVCRMLLKEREDFLFLCTADEDMVIKKYESPLDNHIVFLNWVDQSKLHIVYNFADICVVPSTWYEPFGITAVEAMACGKPVVASRAGGLAGIVKNEETGFLVEPSNIDGFYKAVKTLLDDDDMRIQMGKYGRRRAEESYDWSVIIDNMYIPLIDGM
ncbi:MAG: glycosyltransferase family 1 protein [Candidatus Schekmanbacteria bacterium]|nr:MAG: glycosyltransferase family 1 protein [Candidatus Schekmanbacteria bacterium]